MKITLVLICLTLFAGQKVNSAEYSYRNGTVTCKCKPTEDIQINYDTAERVNSLEISSCANVELDNIIGNLSTDDITSIKFEDIGRISIFHPTLSARFLKRMEFLNVGYLPEFLSHETFNAADKLEYFHMKNIVIGKFFHTFNTIIVNKFILSNVTVINMTNLDFFEGKELTIIDSYINVTSSGDPLVFQYFDKIEIRNTTFEFPYGGNILINGTHVHLSNNTFINGSVSVTGKLLINLTDSCSDGRGSTLRFLSTGEQNALEIVSHGNRFPSDIINNTNIKFDNQSNVVCPGVKCNCAVRKPIDMESNATACKPKANYGNTVHQETSRGFFLYFVVVASAIVTRI